MPRGKKVTKYDDLLKPLNGDDLKTLISEAQAALKTWEKENSTAKLMEVATKYRDGLKIGSTVYFMDSDKEVSAPVVGITADKIQVEFNGRKRSLPLLKLIIK